MVESSLTVEGFLTVEGSLTVESFLSVEGSWSRRFSRRTTTTAIIC